jgi:hypothetical protein
MLCIVAVQRDVPAMPLYQTMEVPKSGGIEQRRELKKLSWAGLDKLSLLRLAD